MDETRLLQVLKALAHPKRFRMVREIAAAGELSCSQIGERFPLSQPTISHHLKILGDAGLIRVRHKAQHHFISVHQAVIEQVVALLPGRLVVEPKARPPETRRRTRAQGGKLC